MASIISINLSDEKGTSKHPVDRAVIDDTGLVGDAHSGHWHRQISLLSQECIESFAKQHNQSYQPGNFAENLTTEGLALEMVGIRDILTIGQEVKLEITQIGKECHGGSCAVFKAVGRCVMPKEGLFTRVLRGGSIARGDPVQHQPKPLKIKIITLSDRASRGEYADRSGPAIEQHLTTHFAGTRFQLEFSRIILPDEATSLREALLAARTNNSDLVFTTGGTGIGPRDLTPDVVLPLLDKTVPGIMESIRFKYGQNLPSALLSRSVAGVMGTCLVYTLPGSVRAVSEYLAEILKTLPHSLLMLWGIDAHH